MKSGKALCWGLLLLLSVGWLLWSRPSLAAPGEAVGGWPWWVWPFVLFVLTFVLGILAVLAGIGGGVLFVPIAGGFLPFLHIDFVRGAGLMIALSGALAAGPSLIREGLAHLRLAIPISLVASFSSIFGALLGLALPPQVIQMSLGVVIIAISGLMYFTGTASPPGPSKADPIATLLGISGIYRDPSGGPEIHWQPKNMFLGLILFILVGMMAGMFGLGAGWANVPVLNLVMGVPIKIAVGTSYFLLAITDTTAAWIYLNRGALLPLIIIPSVAGIMLGARIGTRLLVVARPVMIRRIVIGVLLAAGTRALLRGFGI